jgi:hypothetical protein
MSLADRYGRKQIIVYYSIISVVGLSITLSCPPLLSDRLCSSSRSGEYADDDCWSSHRRFRYGRLDLGRWP